MMRHWPNPVPRRPRRTNTGWYEGYDYLYEKRFTPDAALQGQTLVLEFEGVYHNAEVWLNGEKLAFNPYGYTDFKVDLTGKLDFDAENVLQVIARNADQPNSRWYSGAGIYRPVTLWVGPEAHLLLDGLRVRTVSIDPPEVEVTAAASAPAPCSCRCWTALPCWPVRPLRPESRCA